MGCEEGEDLGLGQIEAKGFERDFEFVVVDALVFVEVEESELWVGLLVSCVDSAIFIPYLTPGAVLWRKEGTHSFVNLLALLIREGVQWMVRPRRRGLELRISIPLRTLALYPCAFSR